MRRFEESYENYFCCFIGSMTINLVLILCIFLSSSIIIRIGIGILTLLNLVGSINYVKEMMKYKN
ncbi:hypothetical protein KLN56_10780 [Clostridioides difficile]|nr:hypothetical protein [Clostridioides difficile]MDO0345056.1 hypothetical protein [Clostridioides difficile]